MATSQATVEIDVSLRLDRLAEALRELEAVFADLAVAARQGAERVQSLQIEGNAGIGDQQLYQKLIAAHQRNGLRNAHLR